MTQITHKATGHKAEVPVNSGIAKGAGCRDNHSDFGAHFKVGQFKPVHLHSYFDRKRKQGPWAVEVCTGKSQKMETDAAQLHKAHMDAKIKGANAVAPSTSITSALATQDHQKRKEQSTKMNQKPMETLNLRKQRKTNTI